MYALHNQFEMERSDWSFRHSGSTKLFVHSFTRPTFRGGRRKTRRLYNIQDLCTMTATYFNLCMHGVCWVALCGQTNWVGRRRDLVQFKSWFILVSTLPFTCSVITWQFKLVVSWASLTQVNNHLTYFQNLAQKCTICIWLQMSCCLIDAIPHSCILFLHFYMPT